MPKSSEMSSVISLLARAVTPAEEISAAMSWTCCAHLGSQTVDGGLELHLGDGGLAVLRHKPHSLGRLQLALAGRKLGGARLQFPGAGVELCLALREGRLLLPKLRLDRGGRHAGGGHLLFCRLKLGLSRSQFDGGLVQPGLARCGLRFTGRDVGGRLVQLGLRRERIHCALHVRKGLELGQCGRYRVLAGLAEPGIPGLEDNGGRAAGGVREAPS